MPWLTHGHIVELYHTNADFKTSYDRAYNLATSGGDAGKPKASWSSDVHVSWTLQKVVDLHAPDTVKCSAQRKRTLNIVQARTN